MCSWSCANQLMFDSIQSDAELQARFIEAERPVRIEHYRRACVLGAVFMMAAFLLDLLSTSVAKSGYVQEFFFLRLACSLLMLVIWGLVQTEWGKRNYVVLGLLLPALPSAFISVMIYLTDGPSSYYYAGLNLVLLGAAIVLRWGGPESMFVFLEVLALYLLACLLPYYKGPRPPALDDKLFLSHLFFLVTTGVFVMFGSYYYNQLRLREFAAKEEIERNRRQLEAGNVALSEKKAELESSNQQLSQKTNELEQTLVELRQTQEQLVTKEKQASLGVWSAGIIHEMNNPLNFARTGLYALRNKDKLLPEEERVEFKEIMADVEEGINRVHMIVSDLRTYAHPGMEECDEVPVAEAVRVALRFFSGDLQGRVEVVQKIPPDQMVFANRNKLIQVLGNLLQNSVDALKAKDFGDGHPIVSIEGRVENGRSRLILRDNGTGIEKKHLDKIFDPFFTTKDVGKGMGLGLGICYRIIQEFGGTISVQSEPGQYCEFTLDFPEERPKEKQPDE